jgi:hypothetical protein
MKELGVPHYLLERAFGGAILTPSGTIVVPSNGMPMGMPLSWVILNVIHLAIIRIALNGRPSFVVNGDDAVLWCTTTEYRTYEHLCSVSGFVLNKDKTFVSPDSGIFNERYLSLKIESGNSRLDIRPFRPIRWVVPEDRPRSRENWFFGLGISLGKYPWPVQRDLLRYLQIERKARSMGVDPYLPIAFGGLGIRNPTLEDRMVPKRVACFATQAHNSRTPSFLSTSFLGDSTPVCDYAATRLATLFDRFEWYYVPSHTDEYVTFDGLAHLTRGLLDLYVRVGLGCGLRTSKRSKSITSYLGRWSRYVRQKMKVTSTPPLSWTYRQLYDMAARTLPTRRSVEKVVSKSVWEDFVARNDGRFLTSDPLFGAR